MFHLEFSKKEKKQVFSLGKQPRNYLNIEKLTKISKYDN